MAEPAMGPPWPEEAMRSLQAKLARYGTDVEDGWLVELGEEPSDDYRPLDSVSREALAIEAVDHLWNLGWRPTDD